MNTPKHIVVLAHRVNGLISEEEAKPIVPEEWASARFSFRPINPCQDYIPLANSYAIDNWEELATTQKTQWEAIAQDFTGQDGVLFVYMGFAPIPLMLHLGTLLEPWPQVMVAARNHDSGQWRLVKESKNPNVDLKPVKLPSHPLNSTTDVALLISTSVIVNQAQVKTMMPNAEVLHIQVEHPDKDILTYHADHMLVAHKVAKIVEGLRDHYPNLEKIHLFGAISTGMAFLIGKSLNPTMVAAPILTYQFINRATPPYKEAVILFNIPNTVRYVPVEKDTVNRHQPTNS